ncbi:Di-sulfide bridge nucleocytoplasmic transport domain-containing protein [Vararia minispora EC-137]|uniref:Di-sulfide bridge nucleocytoplasmic transport domain-containing protein n=1 Tax=Vararia minispora EC-137 TaxID=1314806 RepID=A0ACB8QUD4_9AGAM|nr:Di-sulfide bridge nucleocytoplasmic transport domain-containing protein [Vararia minispora EC-137]
MPALREERSTEAPMDFTFTSRRSVAPAWQSPQKRPHDELVSPPPSLANALPSSPLKPFGQNQSHTFLFNQPPPSTPHAHPWVPPPNFSPTKAFPPQPEIPDIDMAEASPPSRPIATGALRRVYEKRVGRRRSASPSKRRAPVVESASESEDDAEADEVADALATSPRKARAPRTQNTSHHYTLNMSSPAVAQPDTPYVLLGYLQFFFNLSLVLLFLYCAVQFIIAIQRDMQVRFTEQSMIIVQEIAHCTTSYRANGCGDSPVPAMVRQCGVWETCMQRDPRNLERSKIFAQTLADVVNSFVEPISWKTLIFTLLSLAFMTLTINSILMFYRARHAPHLPAPSPAPQPMPSFPTPFAPAYLQAAPQWKPSAEDEAPTRRRRLENGIAKVR